MLALRVAARQVCGAGAVLRAGAGVGAVQVRSKVTKAAGKKKSAVKKPVAAKKPVAKKSVKKVAAKKTVAKKTVKKVAKVTAKSVAAKNARAVKKALKKAALAKKAAALKQKRAAAKQRKAVAANKAKALKLRRKNAATAAKKKVLEAKAKLALKQTKQIAVAAKKAKKEAAQAKVVAKRAKKAKIASSGPVSAHTLFIQKQAQGKGKVDLKALNQKYLSLPESEKQALKAEAAKNLAKRTAIRQSFKKPASKYALYVKQHFPALYAVEMKKGANSKAAFKAATQAVALKYKSQ
eukprot:TRINITY_DN41_c0_g1_i10.p1 TRINITY_DN41_c0_g1~~TRINITY_DN41_c0_g1_i10.p1  ORF type:complete len:317 (+),score=177.83 TRINITY_DN41_c0_g1_i10:70-951(+)